MGYVKGPTQQQVRDAADLLRRLVELAEAGDLDSSRSVTDQLRGAITALDTLSLTATDRLR